jgi:hypothetical protein
MPHMTSVSSTIGYLFRELVAGRTGPDAYVLNRGDPGLLRSLDALSAAEASSTTPDRVSVAAHVDHIRYSLHRMNGWASETALEPADWGASWRRSRVSDAEWAKLRADLAREVTAWNAVLDRDAADDDETQRSLASSVVHLAYHFGAIRQLADAARGPRETE